MRRPLYLGMSLIVRTASDIYYTIRSFKRSYHRVKSVFDDLSETDGKVSFKDRARKWTTAYDAGTAREGVAHTFHCTYAALS